MLRILKEAPVLLLQYVHFLDGHCHRVHGILNLRVQPKEKPLRTKRGHRKAGEDGKPAESSQMPGSPKPSANGVSKDDTGLDIFAREQKEKLKDKELEGSVDDEITKLWADLSEKDKESYQDKAAEANKKNAEAQDAKKESKSEGPVKKETQDEDVEMTNYDTEEQETQDKDGDE